MTTTQQDNLQYLAFRTIWQHLFRLNPYERFCIAIASTDDAAMFYALRKQSDKIREWIEKYSKYTSVRE